MRLVQSTAASPARIVRKLVAEIWHKLAVLREHCAATGRDYEAIEKTHVQSWLLARDAGESGDSGSEGPFASRARPERPCLPMFPVLDYSPEFEEGAAA